MPTSTDAPAYLLTINHLLSDEEQLIWKSARDFCQLTIAPCIVEHYEQAKFPQELIQEFARQGFFGASLTGYGCAGMNPVAYGLTMLELERQDSGLRSFCSVQSNLVMWPIFAYGDDEQKARWLPGMAKGELIGCFGLSEPNSGSDPGSMHSHARQVSKDGDYVLQGQKCWITNSPIADVLLVWAKTRDFGSTIECIRGFVIERGTPGLITPETKGKLSLRASITGEIIMNDVRVPKTNLLPGAVDLKAPLRCLNQARYGIGWGAVGAAMDVYERARSYALDRKQFAKPIAQFQLTQQKLVDMHNEIGKGLLLAYHFGRLKQQDQLSSLQVSYLKRDNVQMALCAARSARSILGANGIMGDFHVMRHLCNLETVYTYEGTHEIHTLAIGRGITGMDAFS